MADKPPEQQPLPYGKFTEEIKNTQQPQAGQPGNVDAIVNMLSNINRRVRILEDRYANLRRKTQITDQNMLANSKRLQQEIKNINESIKEAKKDIYSMKEKLGLFVKELETCAKADEVRVIDRYVNLWSPIKFVTQGEARSLIRAIIREVLEDDGKPSNIPLEGQSETFNNQPATSEDIKEVEKNRS